MFLGLATHSLRVQCVLIRRDKVSPLVDSPLPRRRWAPVLMGQGVLCIRGHRNRRSRAL